MVGGSTSLGNLDLDHEVTAKANFPMPLLGLSFNYHFTNRWTAGIHTEGFALSIDDYSGSLVNLSARTEYWFFNHFGAGLALTGSGSMWRSKRTNGVVNSNTSIGDHRST